MYGFRVGALFTFVKDAELAENLVGAMEAQIRGTYSSPNGPALSSLAKALLADDLNELSTQIYNNTVTLKERSDYFIEKLQGANIKYLPYVSGFFICLPCTDAYDICEQLKEQHTYLVPIADDIVRVAICSLNKEEIDEMLANEEIYEYDISYFFGETISEKAIIYTEELNRQLSAQFPTLDEINRCAVMEDFGDRNTDVLNMWSQVKSNPVPIWAYVFIVVVVLVVAAFIFIKFMEKKIRISRYKAINLKKSK